MANGLFAVVYGGKPWPWAEIENFLPGGQHYASMLNSEAARSNAAMNVLAGWRAVPPGIYWKRTGGKTHQVTIVR